MGRSSGAGSPVWFMCYNERRNRWRDIRGGYSYMAHEVVRTGAKRPYQRKAGTGLGVRSMRTSYEYRCKTCGHVGWTNHKDIVRQMYDGVG